MIENLKEKLGDNNYFVLRIHEKKYFGIVSNIYITPVGKLKYYHVKWMKPISKSRFGEFISESLMNKYGKIISKEEYLAMKL